MRFWKQISLTLFLFAAIIAVTVQSSCEKNACNGITCYNGGSCGAGFCRCPTGYEGAQCQSLSTTRYLGGYAGYMSCNNGAYTVDTVTIVPGNRGILSVDVHVQSLEPKVIQGNVNSNESTYAILVTNNDSSRAGSTFYRKSYTITLQSDKVLSIHSYEQNYAGTDDTSINKCLFISSAKLY